LIAGGELFDRIVKQGHYTEHTARLTAASLLEGVAYLHDNHIIHRFFRHCGLAELKEIKVGACAGTSNQRTFSCGTLRR
jgi:hypothetical protein